MLLHRLYANTVALAMLYGFISVMVLNTVSKEITAYISRHLLSLGSSKILPIMRMNKLTSHWVPTTENGPPTHFYLAISLTTHMNTGWQTHHFLSTRVPPTGRGGHPDRFWVISLLKDLLLWLSKTWTKLYLMIQSWAGDQIPKKTWSLNWFKREKCLIDF